MKKCCCLFLLLTSPRQTSAICCTSIPIELAIGTAHLFYPAALALREFALGLEGLERYVAAELLRRVHECAFALRALESEPVDPRL